MKIAIIGAGRMGRWFAKFFLEQGFSVIVSDKDPEKLAKISEELNIIKTTNNVKAVQSADRILICVPIDNFEEVVSEIQPYIHKNHEIMDICSVKEKPVELMHKYIKTGTILGTHPMFGPGVKNIKNQNFILTPTNAKEEMLAKSFGEWLKNKGARVYFMTPKEHDEIMSIVLGLPYFLSYVTCETLISCGKFSEAKKTAGPSYKLLLTLVEALVSEETEFAASLQMSLPKVGEVADLFLEKVKEWLKVIKRKDKMAFINKAKYFKGELAKSDPDYSKAYEIMYKILEAIKSEN